MFKWSIEKQNQLDSLLDEYDQFHKKEIQTFQDWFEMAIGVSLDEEHVRALLKNATQLTQILKPFSRLP